MRSGRTEKIDYRVPTHYTAINPLALCATSTTERRPIEGDILADPVTPHPLPTGGNMPPSNPRLPCRCDRCYCSLLTRTVHNYTFFGKLSYSELRYMVYWFMNNPWINFCQNWSWFRGSPKAFKMSDIAFSSPMPKIFSNVTDPFALFFLT